MPRVDNPNNTLGMCKLDRYQSEAPISKLWRDVYTTTIAKGNVTSKGAMTAANEAVAQYREAMKSEGVD